jgi:competence protein ComFC
MLNKIFDLLYPRLCFACNSNHVAKDQSICLSCEYKITPTVYHRMPDNIVAERFYGRVKIERATTAFSFVKGGLLQELIHKLKYDNRPEIGIELGKIYGNILRESGTWNNIDYVIPVPLHPKKKHQRGYNQAEMWGQGLAESLGIELRNDLLIRTDYTESQTKKSRTERFANVENVFSITDQTLLNNKKILLVDDVLTTGATLEACSNTLLNASELSVNIVCIALAD